MAIKAIRRNLGRISEYFSTITTAVEVQSAAHPRDFP